MSRSGDEPTTPEGGGCRCLCGDGAGDAARRAGGPHPRRNRRGGRCNGERPRTTVPRGARARALAADASGGERRAPTQSPLSAVRAAAALWARLAVSPRAALRNLAYLHSDWSDPALRRQVLRHARATRARVAQLLTEAAAQGDLRADTDVQALARMIEVTLAGSFLAWTLHREGSAAARFREDLDATLRPYLAHGTKRVKPRS